MRSWLFWQMWYIFVMITIVAKTIKGKGIGKKLGFPTLNIPCTGDLSGVFVGRVFVNDNWYFAAINIGGRPTVDDENFCEAFLLDFKGRVANGTEVAMTLGKKIRHVEKFKNLTELKKQIAKDVEFVKNWYNPVE